MKYLPQKHLAFASLSLLLVIPFFILEAVTTNGFAKSGFPLMLFVSMLVISAIFVWTLISIYRDLHIQVVQKKLAWFILKILVLVWSGWSWIELVMDQMPCFLGASGC